MNPLQRLVGNGLWWLSCLPDTALFLAATCAVERTQALLLKRLLRRNACTAYGRLHGFERIASSAQYQEAAPLTGYEDYVPFVERIAAGEHRVLTREPVRLLEPTSGSSGGSKLIPYTSELKRQFQRAIAPWVAALFAHDPGLFPTASYWTVTPAHDPGRRTEGGIPIGFEEDAEYLGPVARRLVEWTQAVPSELSRIRDAEEFYRRTVEHLVASRDLGLISAWSPSFLLVLCDRLPPGNHWPRLRWISCWCDGPSEPYAARLKARFPGVRVQPKGLIGTEGIVSLPWPGVDGNPLALRSHFFEFLPVPEGPPRLAHQLERGRVYEVVLTTGGGFYRYRTGDLVRVRGFWRGCPTLGFLGRRGGVCDRFGEKLHPNHVQAALARCVPEAEFSMVAFAQDAYALFVQASGLSEEQLRERAARLEQELLGNFHYGVCRHLGQLDALRCFRVREGALEAYCEEQVARGRRLGDVKPRSLEADAGWERVFRGHWLG
ncbi:MAG: GH3 auxin-responsive promoter family protein [Armatimonadetes bacterium]|nr:GH3 auxin-responsive promoter family protein [Armatimonadota bacterium]